MSHPISGNSGSLLVTTATGEGTITATQMMAKAKVSGAKINWIRLQNNSAVGGEIIQVAFGAYGGFISIPISPGFIEGPYGVEVLRYKSATGTPELGIMFATRPA